MFVAASCSTISIIFMAQTVAVNYVASPGGMICMQKLKSLAYTPTIFLQSSCTGASIKYIAGYGDLSFSSSGGDLQSWIRCTQTLTDATVQQQLHLFNGPLSWTTQVSQYQKGKTNLDLLKQETVSGSGISWAKCKSAPRHRQKTTSPLSFFTGRTPFLLPNQQHKRHWSTVQAGLQKSRKFP